MAEITYKPLGAGQAATYGYSGDAVKQLQTQLNQTNQGVAGYTPLKVDGLYGPLTQAATGFKAPAATTTPPAGGTVTPPVDTARYARTANSNDQVITDLNKKLDSTVGDAPDLATITAQKKANAQALVDSVTAQFARTLEAQGITNDTNNARVRASNISSGLGGSDFGTTRAIDQETKGKKAIELIEQEKAAKIQAILADVDDRSSAEYQRQRIEYVKSLGDQLDRVKAAKDEDRAKALGTVKSLAQQGVAIDKLKTQDPTTYNTLLQEYGGSQIDLESEWNEALPDHLKVKYDDKVIMGPNGKATLFRYGLDPKTGTVDQKEYDLGVDYNTLNGIKPVTVGGRLFALTTDAKGNQIAKPLTDVISKAGSGSGGGKIIKDGSASFTGDQISSFEKELQASKKLFNGDGKYVNPESYQEAYDAWIEVGGTSNGFLKQFPPAKYVNPANNTLPEYLRSARKTSTVEPKKTTTSASDL